MISLTIDNRSIQAEEGTTILEAARGEDINIPTLCYFPLLKPLGGCRLCVVEIISGGRSRLVTSCTYPVEEGLEVKTRSPEVIEVRKMLVELLLARAPKARAVRFLAREYGIEKPLFKTKDEGELCILCGLCARVCDEIIGASAINFVDRGVNRAVTFNPEISPELCVGCGVCTAVCPTGCLELEKPYGVISAIDMGRTAAVSIDKYLGGTGEIEEQLIETDAPGLWTGSDKEFAARMRMIDAPWLKEFTDGQAISEAGRCLRCDLRFEISPSVMPPEQWLKFDEATIATVPELEGVYVLYDENKEIYNIVGVIDLRAGLTEELEAGRDVKYFIYELDPMYTGKERQLVQQYMKQHGKMPPGADDLDDLF
jgi:bidirectional [NiFe] hydrogenase diaphorase subunit